MHQPPAVPGTHCYQSAAPHVVEVVGDARGRGCVRDEVDLGEVQEARGHADGELVDALEADDVPAVASGQRRVESCDPDGHTGREPRGLLDLGFDGGVAPLGCGGDGHGDYSLFGKESCRSGDAVVLDALTCWAGT